MTFQKTRAMVLSIALFCVAGLSQAHAASKPEWIFKTTPSTEKLAAVGSGSSVAEARQIALGNILLQVSQSLEAGTSSVLTSEDGESNSRFRQVAIGRSLKLDVGHADIVRQWQDPETGEVYLQLTVAKAGLIRALENRLSGITALSFPASSGQTDQLLWALKNLPPTQQGLRIEAALSGLGAAQPAARQHLLDQQEHARKVWQAAGVRVIAQQSLGTVARAIRPQLPTSTNTALWLQLDNQTFHRQTNGQTEIKRVLSVNLKQPHAPFTSYHQSQLIAFGSGSSRASAEQAAEKALTDQLQQPLAHWLF